jgi:hypothetical protein
LLFWHLDLGLLDLGLLDLGLLDLGLLDLGLLDLGLLDFGLELLDLTRACIPGLTGIGTELGESAP